MVAMIDALTSILAETVKLSLLVLAMMTTVDLLNVWARGRIEPMLRGAGHRTQYFVASAIGTLPGCIGGFTNVSLYIHGMISFGALVGAMVAVSGDEAFVMLALFPRTAILLFVILLILGIVTGWAVDIAVRRWKIRTCENCRETAIHEHRGGIRHYLSDHLWKHIILRHLTRTALWTFGSLAIVHFGMTSWNLDALAGNHACVVLLLSAVIGLIPDSGPHLIFVTLYAHGIVPFSVLLTSSIVQDGHGMLPLFAYSLRDSLLTKSFNLFVGLVIGLLAYAAGF
jgi:hypothetical protein